MRLCTILSIIAVLLCSCTEPNEEQRPAFGFTRTTIEVAEIGGDYEAGYTLNDTMGITPVAVTEAEWIADIDNSTVGTIRFRVLPNLGDTPREATITLRHTSTKETPTCIITQPAGPDTHLALEITKLDYSECEVSITPHNDELQYIVMMAEKSYLTGLNISNTEELIEADRSLFNSYVAGDKSLEATLEEGNIAMQGNVKRVWQDLSPAREYVIYAYGIYLNGDVYECITPVSHILVEKRLPERSTELFEVDITADGPEVTFDVAPKSWEGYYAVQIIEDTEAGYVEQGLPFTPEAEEAVAEAFFHIADHLYYFEEMDAEAIMQQLGYRGDTTFSKTLNANHRYMALIYAIASDNGNVPMVVSHPEVYYFTTGTVERSEMTFEVCFENVRPRSVDVTITPSSDEPYTAVLMYAKNMPTGDKQEQLEYVMSKYAPFELSGTYIEHITQLPPATEFILAVYGYYAGAATTDLFIYRFATMEDGEGKNYITAVATTAYDLGEVAALEPYYASFVGYADYFMSIDITTATPAPALHFDIFRSDVTTEYSLEEIREGLLESSYSSSPDWALCTYGNEYVICGLAEDSNGYVGELYVSEPFVFVREDVGDAAQFVELYSDYVTRSVLKQSIF
ncbi:MAG: hypothetical protein J6V26_06880 [Alistipes sp.]|nr:hypothetical protein [Alistipes sp.]